MPTSSTCRSAACSTGFRDEFALHAEAKGLIFRVVGSTRVLRTDPALLEQMLRNLVSNALKYTPKGKVLLGCRLQGGNVRIEVWDTGIGIPASEIEAVFEEYHQLGNAARERSHGLGLGLAIVQRLGDLIGHPVKVRSWHNKGSVFSVEVPQSPAAATAGQCEAAAPEPVSAERTGTILLVEDHPDVCTLLAEFLGGLGHRVVTAINGVAALAAMAHGAIRPDLVLSDYNLPNRYNGLELGDLLRQRLGAALPVVILTGDISKETLADVAASNCLQLSKPVQLDALASLIQHLLPAVAEPGNLDGIVFIVDDDASVRESVTALLEHEGRPCIAYPSCEAFLAAYHSGPGQCLLLDAHLPGLGGLDLLRQLKADGRQLPTIMITGSGDVSMAVEAMRAGAADFIEKPVAGAELTSRIERTLHQAHGTDGRRAWEREATRQLATLTTRQREVMAMVLDGHPSKNIAADLQISQRTVENHRAAIMHKTGATSLPALARLAMAVTPTAPPDAPPKAK